MKKILKGTIVQLKEDGEPIKFIPFGRSNLCDTNRIKTVIVEVPLIPTGKVKEILTGVTFDATYESIDLLSTIFIKKFEEPAYIIRAKSNKLNTMFEPQRKPTLKELKEYTEKNNNIEEYRKELENIKINGNIIAEGIYERIRLEKENKLKYKQEYKNLVKQISYK